ncbi:GntR family transcriptional regulator [Rhizobium rhizogenes]|nr:GntR family transcriptional regulator [Rhizobium rhizogenes]NTG71409.1 GntR family transcriptional regulator [Rhizobium rhizogenes]TRB05074.1 GntR family transcriptional regulator [Rhizobium rhizogenes]TRB39331.1 GntR family transcriptional regulator [Rhizobium rhizogenes]TRB54609.1 GntR family transcriptional regulator [Rhizobium rhizogenes]
MDTEPMYIQLQQDLLRSIQNREFEQGSRFPSERELSQKFRTSRVTMRKAIDRLVQMGVLERRGTSGTYLPDRLFDRPISEHVAYSISDVVEKAGHVPGSKLLFFERKVADKATAAKLSIAVGDPIISIQRQRTVDGIPVCVEFSLIPARMVPGLSAADVIENKSLYAHLRDTYQLNLHNKSSSISIHRATEAEAEFLNLSAGASVLRFDGVTETIDGIPFEHLRSLNHPDYVSFSIEHQDYNASEATASPITMMMGGRTPHKGG